MSPEQLRGEVTDQRSDIGRLARFCMNGDWKRPFPFSQVPLLIDAILNKPPEPPSALNPDISPGLEVAILQMSTKIRSGAINRRGS